jgi:hypothetical protein
MNRLVFIRLSEMVSAHMRFKHTIGFMKSSAKAVKLNFVKTLNKLINHHPTGQSTVADYHNIIWKLHRSNM